MMITVATTDVLYDAEAFAQGYRMVSDARRARIDRRRTPEGKCQSLGASLLLKRSLSLYGIDDAVLDRDEYGKPFLCNHSDVHFNLSHSGNMVMCVIADTPIGCDVQEMSETVNARIAERYFSPMEQAAFLAADEDDRRQLFFRLWTLKESFLKATGYGLRVPLSSFSIDLRDPVSVTQSFDPYTWHFSECDRYDGYHLAVCSRAPVENIYKELSLL